MISLYGLDTPYKKFSTSLEFLEQEPQGALIAHLSTMNASVKS